MIEPVHRDLLIGQQFLETPKSEKRIHRLMRLMGIRRGIDPPDQFLNLLTADLPDAQHKQADERAQNISLPAQRPARESPEPGLVFGHHLYLPMWRGFLYLVAIMGWHTRKVLS